MAKVDPRIAVLAQTLQSRLELEASVGHRVLAVHRLPENDVLPVCQTSPEETPPSWPGEPSAPTPAANAAPSQPLPEVPVQEIAEPDGPLHEAPTEAPLPVAPADRETLLAPVCEEALSCTRCRLSETRQHVVFGEGPLDARIMFVGEGPGAEEDRQGRPFVGRAGEMLTRMIENVLEITREDVYITNIIKCRPPGNRNPQPDEVMLCHSYLKAQIDTIHPDVIITLGRPAANTLLDNNLPMNKMRGTWFSHRDIPLMPIYHPAYLLRQREQEGGTTRADRLTLGDLLLVKQRLKK